MLRPVSLLPALVVAVATVLGAPVGPARAEAPMHVHQPVVERTPLAVTMDSLSPATIPRKGPVRVSGSVTNRDDQTWTDINVYAFVSDAPLTTTSELADAATVGPSEFVGARILTAGTYDSIDELAPGESMRYSVTVPRSELPDEPGVYWFGTHALGFNDDGGDSFADGRARTFLPLVPPTGKSVDTSLVIPVRHEIRHDPDGRIADTPAWTEALSPGGSLRDLVDLGAAAGSRPVTWLVDPAVVDAVRQLAAGNPARSLGPTTGDGDAEGGDTGGDASASPDASSTPEPDAEQELSPEEVAAADAASSWLERLHEGLQGNEILTLPYGDLDVAAAAELRPQLYRQARRRSSGDLQPWGLATSPAVGSPSGYLDARGIKQVEPNATVLVTDRMLGARAPAVVRTEGHTLAVTSSGAASGGPGPNDRQSPLAMRQRIVSEAALRLLTPGRKPLLVMFPATWSPSPASAFFDGLDDLDWLDLTTVASATRRAGTSVPIDRLRYPPNQHKLELDEASFAAVDDLVQAGDTLQNLLTRNDQVGQTVRDEAFTDASYSNRLHPELARLSAVGSQGWIEDRLRSVHVDAPKAVILSSGSGRFSATVTNELDQPVTVRIQALADAPLKVAVPADSVDLAPDSRTTVLLNASSSAIGIRNVTLVLTDVEDVPLGSSDVVPIRSNRVSNVIWLIIGTGIALLFGAIVLRLVRRVRTAARS